MSRRARAAAGAGLKVSNTEKNVIKVQKVPVPILLEVCIPEDSAKRCKNYALLRSLGELFVLASLCIAVRRADWLMR